MSDSASRHPRVYIVVLNWNGSNDTIACIESLLSLTYQDLSVLICDNNSRPDQLSVLRQWGKKLDHGLQEVSNDTAGALRGIKHRQVILLHTGDNLGFAGGVNTGLRLALEQGDLEYAWILNNDTEADQEALSALVERASRSDQIGICGSTLVYHGRRDVVQAFGGASYEPWRGRSRSLGAFASPASAPKNPAVIEDRIDYIVGASMLVSRRLLERVGLMDERYFLYSEEHDWAHRAKQCGFTLAWSPASVVFHKHGASIGSSASGGSPLSLFYLFRSKVLFSIRHYPLRTPVVFLSLSIDAAKFLIKGSPSRAIAAFRGMCSLSPDVRF